MPELMTLPIDKPFENPSSWAEWDKNCQYRAVHYKFKEQLQTLKDFYPYKLDRLIKQRDDILAGHQIPLSKELFLLLEEKIARLTDKYNTVKKEIEGRKLGHFPNRPEHGTIYYIDLDAGNDGSNGLGTGTAWLTLEKYTTTTVRTAGDIAKLRANTDEAAASWVSFDEDGNVDDYIEVRGCSVADDPWGDASDVKPIIIGGATPRGLTWNTDDYWKINRLVVKGSQTLANLYIITSWGLYFLDCESTDQLTAAKSGASIASQSFITFESCIFKDNLGDNIFIDISRVSLISCTLNGGATTTDYGIRAQRNSYIEAISTTFGSTTSHDTQDVDAASDSIVKLRDCTLDAASVNVSGIGGVIYEEDADGSFGAGLITTYQGTIAKTTGTKTGTANFSLEFTPNANCGLNSFLSPNNNSIIEYPFIIECTTGVSKTVTVQIRSKGTWLVYPIAAELFLEFWYLDHAVDATRTKVVSTEVLAHASNWVSFTCTFTPLQTGLAYGTVKLGIFEDAGDGAYVNGEVL